MPDSNNLIQNRLIIKNLFADILDRAHLVSFKFKKQNLKGTFCGYDSLGEALKFALDRKYEFGIGSKFSAEYVHKKEYYSFESSVTESSGSTICINFPNQIMQHATRESKRLNVLDKEIPIRIHFLGAGSGKKSIKEDNRITKPEYVKLSAELQEDIPDIAKIGKMILGVLRTLGDKCDLKLGKLDKTFYPAEQTMKELKKTFFMPDANKADTFMARSIQFPIVGQFQDFIDHQHKIKKAEMNAINFWMEEYRVRKISSEIFSPIIILDSVIGYLYVGTSTQNRNLLNFNNVGIVMALADVLAEAVIKRNINSKNVKTGDVYHVRLADLSDGGMRFIVKDAILLKILSLANELQVDINFFDKWVTTYGEVLRILPGDLEGTEGNFSFRFLMDNISTNDRLYLKRLISYFESNLA